MESMTSKLPILCSQAPYGQDCCCCNRCSVAGCDLKVIPCGCCLHARCCPVSETQLLQICPTCGVEATGLHLIPIAFDEIDQALAEAAQTSLTNKRGKKRQNATVARLNPAIRQKQQSGDGKTGAGGSASDEVLVPQPLAELNNELRTGRWTAEETSYCDKLIQCFEQGILPLPEKIKLNDFLSNMLKSKQSRLTKKMKNAKLSAKQYKRSIGFIMGEQAAREFSQLETALFASIKCRMERSELKFHMQKVWRELFCHFCATIGQKLDLEDWLLSVEEMERRQAKAQESARRAHYLNRKAKIGSALEEDTKNAPTGVIIDPNVFVDRSSQVVFDQIGDHSEMGSEAESIGGNSTQYKRQKMSSSFNPTRSNKAKNTSFVARVMHYVQSRQIPFEHLDVWVPSTSHAFADGAGANQNRLSFGGCATGDSKTISSSELPVPLSAKEQYDLVSFGEYSQRFSFRVGCGLPGRVFSSGIPSWEQGIKSAPETLFERGGGARQWGVETALGLPINSPSVGRIVVVLYSILDRDRDQSMVAKMTEELARLMPMPRWKLVVDVGADSPDLLASEADTHDSRETDLKIFLQNLFAGNASLPQQIEGMAQITQILVKSSRSPIETELVQDTLNNFASYKKQGRADMEVAFLTCRDFLLKQASVRTRNNTGVPVVMAAGASTNPSSHTFSTQTIPAMAGACCANPSMAAIGQISTSTNSQTQTQSGISNVCDPSAGSGCCPPPSQQNPMKAAHTSISNGQPYTNQFGNAAEQQQQQSFLNDFSELESSGALDLGVSAMQLAQLLQNESTNFT